MLGGRAAESVINASGDGLTDPTGHDNRLMCDGDLRSGAGCSTIVSSSVDRADFGDQSAYEPPPRTTLQEWEP